LSKFAWRLTIDRWGLRSPFTIFPKIEAFPSQRTLVALQFPPHVVAIACIYLAALLSTFEQNDTNGPGETQNNLKIVTTLRDHGPWEKKFQAQVDDLEGELKRR
jgi:CTD kinase subunit beta